MACYKNNYIWHFVRKFICWFCNKNVLKIVLKCFTIKSALKNSRSIRFWQKYSDRSILPGGVFCQEENSFNKIFLKLNNSKSERFLKKDAFFAFLYTVMPSKGVPYVSARFKGGQPYFSKISNWLTLKLHNFFILIQI